jgi:hypothetical protein
MSRNALDYKSLDKGEPENKKGDDAHSPFDCSHSETIVVFQTWKETSSGRTAVTKSFLTKTGKAMKRL